MTGSVVRLPAQVQPPFQVFINGVPQREGTDYELRDGALHFSRSLAHEGKLGAWRWFLGAWGIGTYRDHDSVDVRYELHGQAMVAEGLVPEDEPTAG
ncbi:MAG: hypothetical protein ACSLFR_05845 [Solirubrobacteraceae bacterium]